MRKKALITGITGQDGSYLAEFLLDKGYEVHGIRRRSSFLNTSRIDHIFIDPHDGDTNLILHYADMGDGSSLLNIINKVKPDEIYNLAAMSHVQVSFEQPEYAADVDGVGTLRILEAVRILGMIKDVRIYQASTSELYGLVQEVPQTETTPFYPRSPYAAAKMYAFWIAKNYREAYGMHVSNGILFNHESPRRGENFVTRKITIGIGKILKGQSKSIYLGNLDAKRDWGHAKDYIEMMWLMLQEDYPADYVAATGRTETIRFFVEKAFKVVGINLEFKGQGINEKAIVTDIIKDSIAEQSKFVSIGDVLVEIDEEYFRPTEVELLVGDSSKAKNKLGWVPKIKLEELIEEMVQADL